MQVAFEDPPPDMDNATFSELEPLIHAFDKLNRSANDVPLIDVVLAAADYGYESDWRRAIELLRQDQSFHVRLVKHPWTSHLEWRVGRVACD